MRCRLLTAALLGLLAPASEAGPWALGDGHFYSKLSYQRKLSSQLAQPDGTIFNIPRFTQDDAFFYLALGVSGRVTLIASVPFVRSSDLDDSPDELTRATAFGDVQAGLQVQLGRAGPWVFAARGTLQAPTGNEELSGGLQATGSGVWEAESVLGAGRSLARGKGYGFVEVGPYFRGGGLRDGLSYRTQLGWNLGRRVIVAGNLAGLQRWSNTPGELSAESLVGLGDGVTYAGWGPTLIVKLGGGWGAQADWEALFHAHNIAVGDTWRFGLTYQR